MGQEVNMKDHLRFVFIFSEWGNYGEFVQVCVANNIDEALLLCEIEKNGWSKTPKAIIQASDHEESKLIFSGGGDNG